MKYEIKELKRIAVSELQVSNEAGGMNPGGVGDREALRASIDDVGLLEPITVARYEDGEDRGWKVLDGAGRLMKLTKLGETEVDCMVVDCSDWNEYVLSKNTMGRGRSAGCRIMSYLVMHRADVIEFRRGELLRQEGGVVTGFSAQSASFSVDAIAKRLGYKDRKDVGLGVALLWCENEGVDYKRNELNEVDGRRIHEVLNDVLRGKTPIRRWKAGFAGLTTGTQEGEAGITNIQYVKLATRAITSLTTVVKDWNKIDFIDQDDFEAVHHGFRNVVSIASDSLREMVVDGISDWRENDKVNLYKQLKKELGK